MSHSLINQGHPRFAALDGLRALAVVPVILFHCGISGFFDAGFFGVDVFFTISGFIITAMLLKEYRADGDFRFSAFYFRRLKRLLPPVVALVILAGFTYVISDTAFAAFRADVPAALAYVSNLWQIVEKQSYFDDTPHVLKHLWSLAVEEQFYVVWPPIAYLFLKRFGSKATGALALLLACASTAWMCYLYQLNVDGADQNRIYLGTDTHAMGLLAGAALACFWNPWAPRKESAGGRWLWRLAACLALGCLGYIIEALNPSNPAVYRGGFLLVPALTGVVAYCTMNDPRFFVARLFRTDLAQWLGSRSYSLYLVHWLVFVWMRLGGYDDFSHLGNLSVALAVVAVLSELMYRLVEAPSKRFNSPYLDKRQMGVVIAYSVAALSLFGVMRAAPGEQAQAPAPAIAAAAPGKATPAPAQGANEAATAPVPEEAADADEMIAGGEDIYAIGDSVLLGAKEHLLKTIPGIGVDAAVGRQASQGLKVIRQWRSKSGKASTILLHLGTNGYINETQFRELLGDLADRKSVVVINVHANRRWAIPNNEMITRLAPAFPNMRVIDWNAVSSGRLDYFVKDGIHLTPTGMRALTAQIKSATGGAVIVPTKGDAMLASENGARALRRSAPKAAAAGVDKHGAALEREQAHAPATGPDHKEPEAARAPPPADSGNEPVQTPAQPAPDSPETAQPG